MTLMTSAARTALALRLLAAVLVLLWSSPARVDLAPGGSGQLSVTERTPQAISAQRPVVGAISEAKVFQVGPKKTASTDDNPALLASQDVQPHRLGRAHGLLSSGALQAHLALIARARAPPNALV